MYYFNFFSSWFNEQLIGFPFEKTKNRKCSFLNAYCLNAYCFVVIVKDDDSNALINISTPPMFKYWYSFMAMSSALERNTLWTKSKKQENINHSSAFYFITSAEHNRSTISLLWKLVVVTIYLVDLTRVLIVYIIEFAYSLFFQK